MKIIKLGEIAKIDISNVDKKVKEADSPVVLCNFVDVYHNWAITNDLLPNLMKSTANANQISRFSIYKGQVAITKDSETRDDIGVSTYIADNIPNGVLGYHCALITPDENLLTGKYLNVVLHTPYAQKYFELNASGSGQRYTLTVDIIAGFPVPVPDIKTQHIVGDFYSAIDKKLSNNNRINAELESMAKTIYDYWFTQFDFSDENGKPYKSSGGKMVWNEELKREIPEGWKVKPLGDIIDISNRRINSKEIGDRVYVPIEVIPRKKMSFYETADIEKAATGLCPFEKNSILLSNRRVYFHKVSISPFDGVTRDTVIIINPKNKNNLGYVYQLVNSTHFIEYATRNSYGTEQPVLATPTVQNYLVLIPNNDLATLYSEKIQPLIDKVLSSQLENKELASLRDWLLPMLMNGQVGLEGE